MNFLNKKIKLTNLLYYALLFSMMPFLRIASINITISDLLMIAFLTFIVILNKAKVPINNNSYTSNGMYKYSTYLFIFTMIVSTFFNMSELDGLIIFIQYAFIFGILPIIFQVITFDDVDRVVDMFLKSIIIVTVIGIVLYYFFPFSSLTKQLSVGGRMGSLLMNPNQLGKNIAITLPIMLSLFLTREGVYNRVKNLTSILVLVIGIGVSSSFGSIISVVVGVAIFLILMLLKSRSPKKLLKSILFVSAVVLITIYIFDKLMPEIFIKRILESSETGRYGSMDIKISRMLEAFKVIFTDVKTFLFGVGLGNYSSQSLISGLVHNSYLVIWAETGSAGIIGFLFILLAYGKRIAHSYTVSKKYDNKAISSALCSSYFVFLINMATNTHIYSRFWWIPVISSYMLATRILLEEKSYRNNVKNEG